jgi:uncharacterized protein DUF4349
MREIGQSTKTRAIGSVAVLTVLVALGAVACSSSKGSPKTAAAASSAAASAPSEADLAPAAASSAPAAAAETSAAAAAAPAALPAPANSAAPGVVGTGGGNAASTPLTGRQVIFTADITVRATDIKAAVDKVKLLATGANGVVFGEQEQLASKDPESPGQASATIVVKVPREQFESTLDLVGRVGTELARNEHADDVTAQFVDVNSRIGAAQDSLTRLRQLFQHAGNVADLASVEAQIAQREADLESLEGQQRALTAQTALATITVNLVATPPVAPKQAVVKKAHVFGFWRGLRGGWHAFTKTVSGIGTAFGAVLPFLIVVLVAGLLVIVIRRKVRNAPRDETHTPSADPVS